MPKGTKNGTILLQIKLFSTGRIVITNDGKSLKIDMNVVQSQLNRSIEKNVTKIDASGRKMALKDILFTVYP